MLYKYEGTFGKYSLVNEELCIIKALEINFRETINRFNRIL